MRLEGGLEGRDQLLKLVKGQTGEIQELQRAGLYIGKPDTGHLWSLLSREAQYIINRDNLNYSLRPFAGDRGCFYAGLCHGRACLAAGQYELTSVPPLSVADALCGLPPSAVSPATRST